MIITNPHLSDLVPLFRALHNFHAALRPGLYHSEGGDAAYLNHLRGLQAQGAQVFAADAGWGLVGYLLALPEIRPADALRRAETRWRIDHLYVARGCRGRGLARQLVAEMERAMADRGVALWVVYQDAANPPAHVVYRRVGATDRMRMLEKSCQPE
ncbi:GNAT family N-acetyltransferase [Thalassococcus sp. CAU 1522]|uniref:GNAT family N-acetyltransferase n=1 Tax=Thalassococcus arenae TaxID=2851652 RepID=A0ABS6N4W7_9RHOB|nr:GNAT family N-acetyltransferase [Thalassococcus arenae]MBV2358590.1 GNAT family N-acetyltransferase [Thalassococcus arenae]